jgi:hypothetical protein
MAQDIQFEELGEQEKILLLRAFDYDVDEAGYILDSNGKRMKSEDAPSEFLHIKTAALIPGSLEVVDGSPVSLSKFIREKMESDGTD